MDIETRRNLSPQEFIRQLFAETRDGKVSIDYRHFFDQPYTMTYDMDWTAEDAQRLVQRYNALTAALTRIGKQHEALETEANRKALLSQEEQAVWDTYIRPFAPFDGGLNEVAALQFRSETETLDEEEQALLQRHFEWYETNSLQRLPMVKRTPTHIIHHARRYERLVHLNVPTVALCEEGRCLAEEMALYYHHVRKPKPNFTKFLTAQEGVYAEAMAEIRRGKKKTHWMWFIFPQLRQLGQSAMATTYGIADMDEAKAYLDDILLGSRLRQITEALLKLDQQDPEEIFGEIDATKLKSCMTLFACADGSADSVFRRVLQQYFDGAEDDKTLAVLRDPSSAADGLHVHNK